MNSLAEVLKINNKLQQSEKLYREALDFWKFNFQPNHPEIGNSYTDLAGILASLNRLKQSEEHYRDAIKFRKVNLMLDDGYCINCFALVLKKLNRLDQSEKLFRLVLNFRIANLSSNHPDIAVSLNNLAEVLFRLNRL